jgi:hypothetical protein
MDLGQRVVTAFVMALAGMMTAAGPFDMMTFRWIPALQVSGSVAVLALVTGLAARLSRNKDSAGF